MNLCGVNINCYTFDDLIKIKDCSILVTVNAEAIVRAQKEENLLNIINRNYSSIDGQIPLWLYKNLYPNGNITKLSGSDLIYSLSEYASKNGFRVFLLGGKEESNSSAVLNLRKSYPSLIIDGYSPPYSPYPFNEQIQDSIISRIKKFKPHYLFVGFGMGKQEYWEADNFNLLKQIEVKLIIGCGGSFDFASGKIKRAPIQIQKIGFEGIWRLFQEFKWFRIKRIFQSLKIFPIFLKYHKLHNFTI
ncbi:MAG: WecB/TagA/CpsF family glycosyltransferase [Candidatus Homeothermus sp.]|nr:WecB/TagA/CpsF family glycosyltransferase [Candidatus Homeothermus sp.]